MQNILITAASGNIGARLIPNLLATKTVELFLVTGNAARLSSLSASPHVTIIEGLVSDPRWVETQLKYHEIDTVFLCLFGIDEIFTVFNFLDAIQRASSVKHVVYLSACGDFIGKPDHVISWMCPHTKIKPPVENALRYIKSFTHTVIGPSLFFENDYKVKAAIVRDRRWVEPFGEKGTSRVAVQDIADAVAIAIRDQGKKWNGRKIMLGSLNLYTSEDSAALWSNALGHPITAVPSNQESLDKLEEHLREELGPIWGRDLALLYAGIVSTGFGMSKEDFNTQVEFLGRKPAEYEDFVMKLAEEWKKELRCLDL